jgi:hypothetical protein
MLIVDRGQMPTTPKISLREWHVKHSIQMTYVRRFHPAKNLTLHFQEHSGFFRHGFDPQAAYAKASLSLWRPRMEVPSSSSAACLARCFRVHVSASLRKFDFRTRLVPG